MAKKHRIIKLDNLPMKGKLIDWKNSIGYNVYFEYEDVKGYVKIIDYKDSYLKIKFYNNEIEIFTGAFLNVSFGKLLNKQTGNFKINIGDKFKDDKRDIEIIDREIRMIKAKALIICASIFLAIGIISWIIGGRVDRITFFFSLIPA